MQAKWNVARCPLSINRLIRGDPGSRISGLGVRRPAKALLGIEHILHLPGPVILRLTAGGYHEVDLEIITLARASQVVIVPGAVKKLKSRFATLGRVGNLDFASDYFKSIVRYGRDPRCVLTESRNRRDQPQHSLREH